MRERLQENPELLERIVFYSELVANGDSRAKKLLDSLDETGYLRIACIEILLSQSKKDI